MDDLTQSAETFVSPFGDQHWTQRGVSIRKPVSLKTLLMRPADASEQDLNPEYCQSPLKKRMAYARR